MDTSLPYLIALAWGYRIASVGMAVKIEGATHGLVTREDLRPEEDWAALAPRGELQHAAA
jgi:DNA-binding transcriptional regulator YdaS (Cro superfamily)